MDGLELVNSVESNLKKSFQEQISQNLSDAEVKLLTRQHKSHMQAIAEMRISILEAKKEP